jgi:hypothetical protein
MTRAGSDTRSVAHGHLTAELYSAGGCVLGSAPSLQTFDRSGAHRPSQAADAGRRQPLSHFGEWPLNR